MPRTLNAPFLLLLLLILLYPSPLRAGQLFPPANATLDSENNRHTCPSGQVLRWDGEQILCVSLRLKILTVVGTPLSTPGFFSRASCAYGVATDGTNLSGAGYSLIGGGCWASGGTFGGENVPVGLGSDLPINPAQIPDYAAHPQIDNAYYCYYASATSGTLRAIATCV